MRIKFLDMFPMPHQQHILSCLSWVLIVAAFTSVLFLIINPRTEQKEKEAAIENYFKCIFWYFVIGSCAVQLGKLGMTYVFLSVLGMLFIWAPFVSVGLSVTLTRMFGGSKPAEKHPARWLLLIYIFWEMLDREFHGEQLKEFIEYIKRTYGGGRSGGDDGFFMFLPQLPFFIYVIIGFIFVITALLSYYSSDPEEISSSTDYTNILANKFADFIDFVVSLYSSTIAPFFDSLVFVFLKFITYIKSFFSSKSFVPSFDLDFLKDYVPFTSTVRVDSFYGRSFEMRDIDYWVFDNSFDFSTVLMPLFLFIFIVLAVVFLLGAVAFATVFERKTIAVLQNRRGPNRAGFFGLLQAIGDGIKLVTKAQVSKKQTSVLLYYFAPFCALFLSWLLAFYMLFASFDDFSLYFLLIWTSLNVYSLPIAGIVTSHSKFAFLGGIRSLAQLLSYELSLSVLLLIIVVYTGTPIIGEIVEFQLNNGSLFFSLMPVFFLWFIVLLAETNRVPFDLPEGEAEIVAGFATEYSSFAFAAFFLAEYGSMLIYSFLTAVLFFSTFNCTLMGVFFFFMFVWTRSTLPRFRVDQLLWLGWFCLLPLSLIFFVIYYFRFNLFDLFSFSSYLIPFFSCFMLEPFRITNKYRIVSGLEVAVKKRSLHRFKQTSADREYKSYASIVQEGPMDSDFWLFLPLINLIGSFYHLLAANGYNNMIFLLSTLMCWARLLIVLLVLLCMLYRL